MALGLQAFDLAGRLLEVPRVELGGVEPVRIGRAPDAELRVASGRLARHHARLTWDERTLRWSLEAEGPVSVDARPVRRHVLAPGDRLGFPDFELRVDGAATPARHPGFEAALTRAWDDGTARVYADWLLGQQEPLGEWMRDETPVARRPGVARFARSLLALGASSRLSWRCGFVVQAFVGLAEASDEDEHRAAGAHAAALVARMAAHPLARFLAELEVDLESFRPTSAPRPDLWSQANAVPGVVQALADAAWPALKVLRIVRWDPTEPAPAIDLGRLRARAPEARLELSRDVSALEP